MKKFIYKLLILTVIAAMVVTAMPLTGVDFTNIISPKAKAAAKTETFTWGDYEYKFLSKSKVELVNYYGKDTEVIIPSEINGTPVTSIGEFCFNGIYSVEKPYESLHPNAENNNKITKVTVPSSVKTICREAFGFMENLNEVVLNEGLELIDEFAFATCPKLHELKLPDSLGSFDFTAVDETPITELIFGTNVKSIDIESFEYSHLKRMVFNADVITIENINLDPGRGVLDEIVCNGQLEVDQYFEITNKGTIGKIVCSSDTSRDVILEMRSEDMIPYFNDLDGIIVFSVDETLLNNEHETNGFRYFLNDESEAIISRYTGSESVVVVPESLDGYPVTQIGSFAFSSVVVSGTLITSVNLPETIESINKYAFEHNQNLTQINIPLKVTTIPYKCFHGCYSLEYIQIPESVNKIEGGAFYYCKNLKSISLPESVTEISENTFNGCHSLESIDMPGIRKIGERGFSNCIKLVNIELPDCLTEIGNKAFANCNFERLDLTNVTHIGERAMYQCFDLKEVILNDNLERLENGVFVLCKKLEKIDLPSSLIYIGKDCFYGSGLKSITLNEGLKTIDGSAFSGCSKLSDVVFPESLEYIWNAAFNECDALESITLPVNLKILGYHAFSRCENLTTVYFNAINCKVSNSYGENGYTPGNWATASPFYATKITNIIFGENITTISSNSETYGTFEGCETLQSITIPNTVEEIGTAAFKNCLNLETAIIPDSVEEIADDAFVGCANLTIYCSEESYAYAYASAKGISVSTFVISPISNQVYTGSAIKPSFTVKVSNVTLTKGVDYSVSYSNNINVGQATVVVQGKGDYDKFSSRANFTIVTKNISKVNVADISPQKYTGKAVEPSLSITDNGRYLKEGKDYTVYYYNNVNQGVANAVITGIGNYSGNATTSFEITEFGSNEGFSDWFARFIMDSFTRIIYFILTYFNR